MAWRAVPTQPGSRKMELDSRSVWGSFKGRLMFFFSGSNKTNHGFWWSVSPHLCVCFFFWFFFWGVSYIIKSHSKLFWWTFFLVDFGMEIFWGTFRSCHFGMLDQPSSQDAGWSATRMTNVISIGDRKSRRFLKFSYLSLARVEKAIGQSRHPKVHIDIPPKLIN